MLRKADILRRRARRRSVRERSSGIRRILDLLADERGVSILMALFFVLVVVMVVAIVLSFSVVNGERSKQHAKEEQAYFAVTSAIQEADSLLGTEGNMIVTVDGPDYFGSPGSEIAKSDEFAGKLAVWVADSCDTTKTQASQFGVPVNWHSDYSEYAPDLSYMVTVSYGKTNDGGSVGTAIPDNVTLLFVMDRATGTITVTSWQGTLEDLSRRFETSHTADYNYPLVREYQRVDLGSGRYTWKSTQS